MRERLLDFLVQPVPLIVMGIALSALGIELGAYDNAPSSWEKIAIQSIHTAGVTCTTLGFIGLFRK